MTARTKGWQTALEMLQPLAARIDAELAVGDVDAALCLAFHGAATAASLVSELAATPGGSRLHYVCVELAPRALQVYDDGTMSEDRTYVNLTYQCQDIDPRHAETLAGRWDAATLMAPNEICALALRGYSESER